MKKLALLCLLLATLHARADLVIALQTIEARSGPQTIVIKVKGDKYRTDISEKLSSISDLVSDDIIILDHAAKTYRRIPGTQVQARNAPPRSADPMMPQTPAAPPQLTDTGKSEKFDGCTAEIYTAHNSQTTFTYWISRDYPDYAVISDKLNKIQAMNVALNKVNNFVPDFSKIDGLVVKFEALGFAGKSSITTLLSAKIQPVDDAEFQVPDGYTETITRNPLPAASPSASP